MTEQIEEEPAELGIPLFRHLVNPATAGCMIGGLLTNKEDMIHPPIDVSLEHHEAKYMQNDFLSNFSDMGDSIADYGEGLFDDEDFSVKGEVPFFQDLEESEINEYDEQDQENVIFDEVNNAQISQDPLVDEEAPSVNLERHNDDGNTEKNEESDIQNISDIDFDSCVIKQQKFTRLRNVSINPRSNNNTWEEEEEEEIVKQEAAKTTADEENIEPNFEGLEDDEIILRTIYNRVIPLHQLQPQLPLQSVSNNLHPAQLFHPMSQVPTMTDRNQMNQTISSPPLITDLAQVQQRFILNQLNPNNESNGCRLIEISEEDHHSVSSGDAFVELECTCKDEASKAEDDDDYDDEYEKNLNLNSKPFQDSSNKNSPQSTGHCCSCETHGGSLSSHTILPDMNCCGPSTLDDEFSSALREKRPEIIFAMQRTNKKNVVRNLMRAFRQYFLAKNSLEVTQIFFTDQDSKAVGKKFKRYFGARHFNHNSIKQLVLHDKYGPVFKHFLQIHSSSHLESTSEKLQHLHQVFIDFLLLCFQDFELLDQLETYSKTRNPFQ